MFLFYFRLNFWDLGGQEELQALWDKYFAECHAIIYTVDSNDRERVEESKKSFDVMIKNENLKGVPLLLLANKQDLPGKLKNKHIYRNRINNIVRLSNLRTFTFSCEDVAFHFSDASNRIL